MGATDPASTRKFITELTGVFNVISLISASIVVLVVLALGLYDRRLINRVSFRLQTAIAFSDIIRHTLQFFTESPTSALCPLIGFLNIFFDMLYATLNMMITLNMQLMLLHNYYPKPKWERNYWWFSLLVVSLFNFPFAGIFGANPRGLCFVKATYSIPGLITMEATIYFLTLACSMVYCITIPILVLAKLFLKKNSFKDLKSHVRSKDGAMGLMFERSFSLLIMRNLLYPIACFLSLMGGVIQVLSTRIFGYTATWPMYLSMVCLRLTGFLNLIAFSFDPSLHRAISKVRSDLANREYGESRPNSENKFESELIEACTEDSSNIDRDSVAIQLEETKALLMKYL